MNTKIASFVLVLALATLACSLAGPAPSGQQSHAVADPVYLVNSTPTAESSPTHTTTTVPPTETAIPRSPTSTPAPLIPAAKVIGEGPVNIRSGPCNHPILTEAMPGMEFSVTGHFRSSGGEDWWRVQIPARNGDLVEGWIWGLRVEVTNDTLVPLVISPCPPFATPTFTATATETLQTPNVTRDRLGPNEQLGLDEVMTSLDGRFTLIMQSDGNLVLYRNGVGPLWASHTVGTGAIQAVMQSDGNLVLYTANNSPVWASNTVGGSSILLLQNDGNLVIYREGGGAVWATHTAS